MFTRRCCLLAASLGLLLAGGAAVVAQEESYRTARVSDVAGELAARGPDEDDPSYLERNAIIRPGDVLWTDERGNAEVELERGAWVRLAEDTKLEIRELPPSGEFRLWTGSVYFDLSERIEEPLRVRTPVGDVDVFPESVVRIDLSGEESARVSVYSGRAVALGDGGGSTRLSSGDRAYLEVGRGQPDVRPFQREDVDGFDEYHRRRMDYYVARPLPRELEEPLLGAYDLQDHGSWVVVENERYWRPRAEPDWRPYSNGYWSWVPDCGYSWVDYEPWGYTTSHYGRWNYRPVHGWLWSPRYTWGPAWVHWSNYDNYYGWAPLDPWDRPCYYGSGNGFSIGFGTGNFFIDYRSWSFCDRDRFFYGRHHRRFWGGRRNGFYAGREINLNPGRFRLLRDAHREFGVPRDRVRGLVNSERGLLARDRVLRLEDKVPARRRQLIESRFKTPEGRDRDQLRRGGSQVERLQRNRTEKIDDARIIRGDEADRLVRTPRGGGRNGGANGDAGGGRLNRGGGTGTPARGGNAETGLPQRGGTDDANRGGRTERNGDRSDRTPAGQPKVGDQGGSPRTPGGIFERGGRNGDRNRDRSEEGRLGDPSFRKDEPSPPKPPKPPKRIENDRPGGGSIFDRNPAGRGDQQDRDSRFRRGGGSERGGDIRIQPVDPGASRDRRRDNERPGGTLRPDSPSAPDAGRRDAERRDNERKDNERRDTERRRQEQDNQRRAQETENQRRAQEGETRRRAERDNQERESRRQEDARRAESQRQESQRQESQRRDNERRDNERRDRSGPGRRSYQDFPGSGAPPTAGAGSRAGEDRSRRDYRDFPAPGGSRGGGYQPSQPAPSRPSYSPPSDSGGGSRRSSPSGSYGGGDRGGSSRPSYSPPASSGPSGRSYSPPSGGSSPSYTPPSRSSGSSGGGRSYSPPQGSSSGGGSRSSGGGGRSSGGNSDRGGGRSRP